MKAQKTITKEIQHIGATEYTVQIDLMIPKGYSIVSPRHANRLHISYEHEEKPGEQQSHIIRENPVFPIGIPVRSKGEDAVILIDYEFIYVKDDAPDNELKTHIQYQLPVHIEDSGKDEIFLSDHLPLDEL
ncbi:MAG: hypothetical protein LAT84_14100 [Balneolia bacterium]|nr:hypothetical protein [Balneolia bacterium]